MTESLIHTWFGDPDRRLFGAWHLPASGQVRGVVVVCPPVGKEQGDTTRGQRLLAQRLTERGIAVLRYDHRFTGESWGDQDDPSAGKELIGGLREAIIEAGRSGHPVAVVGLRVGALVAAQLDPAELATLRALVLWQPVAKGRTYVRAERSAFSIALGDSSDDGDLVHLIGATWHREAIEALGALAIAPVIVESVRTAVVTDEPEGAATTRLAEQGAEVVAVPDQDPFVKPASFYVELPDEATVRIATWLDDRFGFDVSPLRIDPVASAVMSGSGAGIDVVTTLGRTAEGVVTWTTTPADSADGRVLVTHGTANDLRIGPGRIWVEAAREVAAQGVSTVRHDRRGVGESGPVRLPEDYEPLHSRESIDDALAVTASLPGDDVVHAGVCSGSWVLSQVATRRPTREVVMVDNLMWTADPKPFSREALVAMGVDPSKAQARGSAWFRFRQWIQPFVAKLMPYPVWKLIGRLKIAQVPDLLLADLRDAGVKTRLVFSPTDHDLFEIQRGEIAVERHVREGLDCHVVVTERGDHPSLHPAMRRAARGEVLAALGLPAQP